MLRANIAVLQVYGYRSGTSLQKINLLKFFHESTWGNRVDGGSLLSESHPISLEKESVPKMSMRYAYYDNL
jgi:hypothetical protein